MVDRVCRETHVGGHRPGSPLSESVDVVDLAHPVLTVAAVPARMARYDLLGNRKVPQLETVLLPCTFTQCHDMADKLVSGNDRRLAVPVLLVVAPEKSRPLIALQVAGADTDGQVLVMHDMLGMVHGRAPRFIHDFLTDERNTERSIEGAFALYQQSVREGSFPQAQHQFD